MNVEGHGTMGFQREQRARRRGKPQRREPLLFNPFGLQEMEMARKRLAGIPARRKA